MTRESLSRLLCSTLIAAAFLPVSAGTAGAQEEPPPCPGTDPYVFLLLDTSGSMNYGPVCTQTQIDNGECSFLCPTGECFVPLQGDDPASKLHQLKEGLQTALAAETDIQLGFGSFNQDTVYARAKHWVYEAQGGGPSLLSGDRYPGAGAQEVFGFLWGCDTGSNDNEIGCLGTKPADLSDTWELTRMQRLPKGGRLFNQNVIVFIRQASTSYKVTYSPAGGGPLGSPTILTTVRVDRCNNATCSVFTMIGQQTVSWSLVAEYLSWENGSSTNTVRTDPAMNFFTQSAAADVSALNTCSGWDPNTDTTSDRFNAYTLRWPTDTSDPRGSYFHVGDVIPWDWQTDHNLDIQERLAPNLAGNPLAAPDVRISPYLQNLPFGAESFLRLKDESRRPLVAVGSTPLDNTLRSFRTWYAGCAAGVCPPTSGWQYQASLNDPDWGCRRKAVVLITDGEETCGVDPCATVSALRSQYGIDVYALGFGTDPSFPASQLYCIAYNGGTADPYLPQTKQELIDALGAIFAAAKTFP